MKMFSLRQPWPLNDVIVGLRILAQRIKQYTRNNMRAIWRESSRDAKQKNLITHVFLAHVCFPGLKEPTMTSLKGQLKDPCVAGRFEKLASAEFSTVNYTEIHGVLSKMVEGKFQKLFWDMIGI